LLSLLFIFLNNSKLSIAGILISRSNKPNSLGLKLDSADKGLVYASTNGPDGKEWGDYSRTSPVNRTDDEGIRIGTGFVLQDGSSSAFIRPHYLI
jgi:hypothetical protein